MKTRCDFVSNSSSSSFLIADNEFFRIFNITKQDIEDVLFELYGGADAIAKVHASDIGWRKRMIDGGCDEDLKKDLEAEIRELEAQTPENYKRPWTLLDLTIPEDREKAFKNWDEFLDEWTANRGELGNYKNFIESLDYFDAYHVRSDLITRYNNGKLNPGDEDWPNYFDHDTRKYIPMPEYMFKTIALVYEKLGIKTNKDVLHEVGMRFFIHFGDNDVWDLAGTCEPSKFDADDKDLDDEYRKRAAVSKWESDAYSSDRFYEVLIKKLEEKGKVKLNDPRLMECWKITDKERNFNAYTKEQYEGKKYHLDDDSTVTWRDIVNDMFNESSNTHEG